MKMTSSQMTFPRLKKKKEKIYMHINTGIMIDWAFIWKTFPWNTTFIINEGHTTTKYYNKIVSSNGKVICMGNN